MKNWAQSYQQRADHLKSTGLYDPADEHDACGVGLIAAIDGEPRREIVLMGGTARYEVNGDEFPFRYAMDRPDLSTVQKFVWLVREISRRATAAILNRGARDVHEGIELVRGYPDRQVFTDEMTWLLWKAGQTKPTAPSP